MTETLISRKLILCAVCVLLGTGVEVFSTMSENYLSLLIGICAVYCGANVGEWMAQRGQVDANYNVSLAPSSPQEGPPAAPGGPDFSAAIQDLASSQKALLAGVGQLLQWAQKVDAGRNPS